MTEEEARAWIEARFGGAAVAKLELLVRLVAEENRQQNLIAPSTVDYIWARHVVDSAQLAQFDRGGLWLDIGTGGGFPGLVVAALRENATFLSEPRRRRAAFLVHCVEQLGLENVEIAEQRVEGLLLQASVISARAVASPDKLLHAAAHCATRDSRWILPRGQLPDGELSSLKERWQGMFHVEQSVTKPSSAILVVDGPRAR